MLVTTGRTGFNVTVMSKPSCNLYYLGNERLSEKKEIMFFVSVCLKITASELNGKMIIPLIIKITISSIAIGLKIFLFAANSLGKLLSDSLLLDSSISQSHSK